MRSLKLLPCILLPIFLLLGAPLAGAAEIVQKRGVRVEFDAKVAPSALPRTGAAPVAVSLGGHISTADGSTVPQLRSISIQINRNGHFDYAGLPSCQLASIQPSSTAHALAACRPSLVGQGHFWANSLLAGTPVPTQGRLLLFNATEGGRPVLYGHIYFTQPFISSAVIPFRIVRVSRGVYGTELRANLAKALGDRDHLTGIEMTLKRSFSAKGKKHSYLSAGCPAPKGLSKAPFSLARASFAFAGSLSLDSTVTRVCRAQG